MTTLNYNSMLLRAQACIDGNDLMAAQAILEDLQRQNKRDPQALFLLYRVARQQARSREAIRLLERAIDLDPQSIPYRLSLGAYYSQLGQYDKALSVLQRALRRAPDDPRIIGALAEAHEFMGQSAEGLSLLEPVVKAGKVDAIIVNVLGRLLLSLKRPADALAALLPFAQSAAATSSTWYLLGEAYDRIGDIDRSFEAYTRANAMIGGAFDLEAHVRTYRALLDAFAPATLGRLPKPQHDTCRPIFIAGRPRSGTTLIEKILDAHPDVAGVGELQTLTSIIRDLPLTIGSTRPYPQCVADLDQDDVNALSKAYLDDVERLAPQAKRIVDKHLSNYEYLGVMNVLFPQARVLHVRRNAVDNCWACFTATLNMSWSSDLHALGATHRLYEKLMERWHATLPLGILDVPYESVVEDQEGWTRRILEFCGLPFDERCLRFHESASARGNAAVSAITLSYNQVKQPVYKSSVGRAARFEKHLQPLHQGLADGERLAAALGSAEG